MGSRIGPLPAVLAVGLALGACAVAPGARRWEGAEGELARTYADFLSARYAGLTADPAASAFHFRRAYEGTREDGAMLDRAVASTLLAGDAKGAAQLAADAPAAALSQAPYARLTRIVDAAARGSRRQVEALHAPGGFGPLNEDVADAMLAWSRLRSDLGKARAAIRQTDGTRFLAPERTFVEGLLLQAAGDDKGALALFDAAWEAGLRKPWTAEAHARQLARQGRREQALAVLDDQARRTGADPALAALAEAVRAGAPPSPVRHSAEGGAALSMLVLTAQNQLSPELTVIFNVLARHLDGKSEAVDYALGRAFAARSRNADAIQSFLAVGPQSAYFVAAQAEAAWLLNAEGRPQAAETILARLDRLAMGRAERLRIADLYFALDRNAEAEALYGQVIAGDGAGAESQAWRPLFARAAVRNAMGRWPEAEADLQRALEMEPNQPDVLNFLGYGWVDRGEKVEEGLKLIELALKLRPNAGHIVDSLGWAKYRLGDYAGAVEHLERAAQLSPSDPEIIDHLGDAYWRLGRVREAVYEWSRAVTLEPKPALRARLETKIASGLPDASQRAGAEAIVQPPSP